MPAKLPIQDDPKLQPADLLENGYPETQRDTSNVSSVQFDVHE